MQDQLDYPLGIDVIVRLHDPSRLLEFESAIFSLLNQSYEPVHAIVVTQAFDAKALASIQSAVDSLDWRDRGHQVPSVINVPAEAGQDIRAKLLNTGIEAAKFRFLAFLDGDDYLYAHAYRHLTDRAAAVGSALTFGKIVCKHVRVFDKFVYSSKTIKDLYTGSTLAELMQENFCPIHSFVVDRSLISPADLHFNAELRRLEDYDFLLRLCTRYPVHFDSVSTAIGVYNWHLDGRGSTTFAEGVPAADPENERAWNEARRHIWRLKTELKARHPRLFDAIGVAIGSEDVATMPNEISTDVPAVGGSDFDEVTTPGEDSSEIALLFPPGHFYSPIVDPADIRSRESRIWNRSDMIEGVELNPAAQLDLLRQFKQYTPTIRYPVNDPGDNRTYFYANDQFPALDAEFLHLALVHFRPRAMIEVGSGFSSLVTANVNRELRNGEIDFVCIEPYPRRFLIDGVPGISRIVQQKVEDVDLAFFDRLNGGDILFVDSSHVSKAGSDVNYVFFHVLPRLKAGVIVHFHDIFLPDEYPRQWVIDDGRNWNEQYLLRAFLQFNTDFEVLWAAHFMGTRHTAAVQETFPNYPKLRGGGSFWIRKIK